VIRRNKEGLAIVLNQIQKEKYKQLLHILGVVNDKNLDEVLPLFPKEAIYYFCKPNIPRGLDAVVLQKKAN
jgi:dihydrofolate synthase/folylpolyglutamate synthase